MARNLSNQVIIITGASAGIGAATAIECARNGMHVVLAARRGGLLNDLVEHIGRLGRQAHAVVGDVADPKFSTKLLDEAKGRFGGFNVVLANAGYGHAEPLHEMKLEALRRIFDVNFFAGFDLLQLAANRLITEQRPGHLLMTSSCLARFTLPLTGAYCATKAAQHHACRAMRMELSRFGIDVSSIHPIGTDTEFFDAMVRCDPPITESTKRRSRLGMMQSPQRVARAIVRCLRRPRPEIWTSFSVRLLAAAMTVFPRLMDVTALRRPQ